MNRRLYACALVGALLASGCSNETVTAEPKPDETRVVSVFHKVHVSSVETAEYFQHAVAAVDFGTDSLARATLS
ncbi:MAG TPA: hypothetical protein VMS65_14865, partial [Polyangiaceae bacterium]|nr:hypothetical protein [Polyangiaceae bacterium]